MKKNLILYGTLTAADAESRDLSYTLLPFGEVGNTSAGAITVAPGVLTYPEDLGTLQFNREHERWTPLGKFTALTETDSALTCTVHISATTAGNDLLVEAADGLRTGISVEIKDFEVNEQYELTKGTLIGAAAVVDPAFSSARLGQPGQDDPEPESEEEPEPDPEKEEEPMSNSAPVPAALRAAKTTTRESFPAVLAAAIATGDTAKLQAIAAEAAGSAAITAALANIGVQEKDHQAQWIGEEWAQRPQYGVMWNKFQNPELTDMWVEGFDNPITNELQIKDYAGAPAEIATITVPTITPFKEQVKRAAVAFNYDRAVIDFSKAQFIESYIQSGFTYWERYLDLITASLLTTSATTYAAKAPRADVDPAVTEVISGMQRLVRLGGSPSTVFLGENKAYALSTEKDRDKLANLSVSMGLSAGAVESATIVDASGLVPDDAVYVTDARAISVFTLGSGPIRVNALALATGQISEALHGYHYERVHDATALLKVTPYVAG